MKKFISILLTIIVFVFIICTSASASAVSYSTGDVTQDGRININDATTIQKYIAGSKDINTSLADFDGNNLINVMDCTLIQKYLINRVYLHNGYIYTVSSTGGTIIGYNGTSTILKIPSKTINGHTIVAIGNSAFKNKNKITSVSIPSTVASVGYYAFQNCTSLEKVTIKNANCHVDSSSFDGCTKLSYFVQG